MSIIELFQNEFMLKAIYGGILISISTAILGVFVVLRKQSFLADGVAHASLAGVALGIVYLGFPIFWAIVIAILMAIIITYLKHNTNISFDASIGIVYSFFFALGIIILSSAQQYTPEISSYLFGSILFISWTNVGISLILLIIVSIVIGFGYRKLTYLTFDESAARVRGINVELYDYLLNILTAIAIVIGVQLMGVVLITSLLVIPATFAKSFAGKFSSVLPLSISYGLIMVIIGIIGSYYLNSPSGATIVVFGALGLFLLSTIKKLTS